MQAMKEAAANTAASAKAGMEKTKAIAQEKAEKMTTRDPAEKDMAEQKKEAKMHEAERMKHQAREQNAAARRADYVQGHHHHHTDPTAAGYTTGGTTTDALPAGVQDPRVAGWKSTGNGAGSTI